ncbi:MAG: CidA/LrgA family protein [Proteobacteria bacterium]|nr:CidA/LrgA family protein [Pseudomonadota bacterium]
MLGAITLLLACQLVGEVITMATGLPLPGPVVGMALLFIGLLIRRRIPHGGDQPEVPAELEQTATGLLSHLSLLFVPAGVGVMLYLPLIAEEWLPITVALVASTLLTIALTALVMSWLVRLSGNSDNGGDSGDDGDDGDGGHGI